MTSLTLHRTALSALAFGLGLCLSCPAAAPAAALPALQPSAYAVQPACAPPAFGHAGCLALRLVRRVGSLRLRSAATAGASASGAAPQPAPSPALGELGYTPAQLHSAYELPEEAPSSQTIALVDAYNDPTAAEDLAMYSSEFGLPPCGGGCFTQYNQEGETTTASLPFPKTTAELENARKSIIAEEKRRAEQAEGWGLEISLDIETARAICHNCHIALVEAKSTKYEDLEAAERTAASLGATEISNSWGGPECTEASVRECVQNTQAFNHPGIVVTASAGDDGYLGWTAPNSAERGFASFPASSPDVVAVGGTRLLLTEAGRWAGETVWNDGGEEEVTPGTRVPEEEHGASGGGCSLVFAAQSWQQNVADWSAVGCGSSRAVADVSADGDPYTGVAVRYSRPRACESEGLPDWCTIGGTSLASPLVASVFALAGGAGTVKYPAQTLYQNQKLRPTSLHDISASQTSGSNGRCSQLFNEETFSTGCTPQQEATTSCSLRLICLAHSGYDGPTGAGTPHGIAAFKALSTQETEELAQIEAEERARAAAKASEEARAEAIAKAEESKLAEEQRKLEAAERQAAESSRLQGSSPTATQPATTATAPTPVRISALALTFKTLLALNARRPKLSRVGFSFASATATPLRVTLARRVRVHGRTRWQVQHTYKLTAVRGTNSKHLSGPGVLVPGEYRLTLTPSGGSAASLVFKLG
jgi:hypothetical protein